MFKKLSTIPSILAGFAMVSTGILTYLVIEKYVYAPSIDTVIFSILFGIGALFYPIIGVEKMKEKKKVLRFFFYGVLFALIFLGYILVKNFDHSLSYANMVQLTVPGLVGGFLSLFLYDEIIGSL